MASLNRPDFLKKGDKVVVVASARKVSRAELQFGLDLLSSWELSVALGEGIFEQDYQFAGSDEIRANSLQRALDNPEVKAIIFARGGYGSSRILDKLNFEQFLTSPKWLIGFSDITAFHSHLNSVVACQTIHSTMLLSMPSNTMESLYTLKDALFGQLSGYVFEGDYPIFSGEATGQLIGGNLSLLHSLSGSNSDLDFSNKILFLEDLDEMLYHVDRTILWMKRAGIFSKIAGLIVGGMSDMRDTTKEFGFSSDNPFGKNAKEIIAHHTQDLDIPICFGLPFGHEDDNRALYLGREITLKVDQKKTEIIFH